MSTLAILLCLLPGSHPKSAFAADNQSLKGISRIWVLIENLDDDLKGAGLTQEQLRTEVELRLRESGITVDPPDASAAGPFLYVEVSAIHAPVKGKPSRRSKASAAGSALYVRLGLQQGVVLKRDPSSFLLSDTWHQSLIGYADPARVDDICRTWVHELTDRFLNAYWAANPKP